ncbi:MAG: Flp pilus assembly complex ATPase component TadA [Phycisphaeraceae bacterium]|nr:Flp pilus assembly complex ATPase component TadA [Phycisphaeraceae bacterium]
MPPVSELKGRKIGRILTKMGKVTREQVNEALQIQTQRRLPLGQLLIELGYVTDNDVNLALAAQVGMETQDLDQLEIPQSVIDVLPPETAIAYQVVPLAYDATTNPKTLTVALKNASNFRAVDDLRLLMGYNVKPVVADPAQVDKLIAKHYSKEEESLADLISTISGDAKLEELADRGESIDLQDLIDAAEDNKVKRLLNLVLMQAIKDKASDVHFEPFEDEFKMRYRIDGVLYEMIPPPKYLALPIVSRVKVMSNLDIAERRLPQDGRIELTVGGSPVDLRVAVLPTMFGESVVMRVLDRSNVALDLGKVGLRPDDLEVFRQLIGKPNGIVIVTGPTGSGKTTTLYAALNELNVIDTKILTAEDPVEYDIDGLCQVQINTAVGLTFAKALRSFLRQDPDIVLVGETRDLETAQIAVQASLTGHLVFTTLHTNDAPSSIARLLDLGLETFLITATIEGVVAQRLVKKICARCKEPYHPSEEQLMELALSPEDVQGRQFYRGRGCDFCNQSGYKGRMGIFEIMTLDDTMRELVMQNASSQILRDEARKRGMRTLRQSGLMAIFDGQTTIDEVVRETMEET